MIFPPLMNGEDIFRYTQRVALLAGYSGTSAVWSEIFGSNKKMKGSANPYGLGMLSKILQIEPLTLFFEHHPAASLKALVPTFSFRQIIEGSLADRVAKVRAIVTDAVAGYPRFCLSCAWSDVAKFGHPFFRRDYCLPGVLICPEHGFALKTGCGYCIWSKPRTGCNFLPNYACMCGADCRSCLPENMTKTDQLKFARIAQFVALFPTQLRESGVNRYSLAFAYRERARILGIDSHEDLVSYITKSDNRNVARSLHVSMGPCAALSKTLLRGRPPPVNLAWNGFYMSLLFDSMLDVLAVANKYDKKVDEDFIARSRKTVESFFVSDSTMTLPKLFEACPEEFVYLSDFDPDWLRQCVQSYRPNGTKRVKTRQKCRLTSELDIRLLKHMKKRLLGLRSARGRPQKVTFAALRLGFRGPPIRQNQVTQLPLTSNFLRTAVESSVQYAVRILEQTENELSNSASANSTRINLRGRRARLKKIILQDKETTRKSE